MKTFSYFDNENDPEDMDAEIAHFCRDPFPEPRIFPHLWDMAAMLAPAKPSRNGHSKTPLHETQAVNTSPEVLTEQSEDASRNNGKTITERDPFPEPRTIPSKWVLD